MLLCDGLLAKARNNPQGLRFAELCKLAQCFGWTHDRTRGSHHLFKRPGSMGLMVFQDAENGRAKPYQVRQLLRSIDQLTTDLE